MFNKVQYNLLRKEYFQLADFTNMKYDAALRYFLCSCNFRLPGEAQKVDRLMVAFADRYVADNPGVIPSADLAYLLAFGVYTLFRLFFQ